MSPVRETRRGVIFDLKKSVADYLVLFGHNFGHAFWRYIFGEGLSKGPIKIPPIKNYWF